MVDSPQVPMQFFSIPCSLCLNFLYKLSPLSPWYGIYVYLVLYLSWILILSVITRTSKGFSYLFILPLLFYFFFFHSSFITFTSASLLLASGVYLCTVEYFIRNEAPMKNVKVYFTVLGICFYLSFLLRWELVLFSLFLFLPMVVFIKFNQIKKALPVLITLVLVIFLNAGLNSILSSSHKTYNEFNKLRATFHDTDKGSIHDQITPNAARKVGWTYEDYLAFKIPWLIYDNHTFNINSLRTFLMENDPSKDSGYYIKNIISRIKTSYERNKGACILSLVTFFSIMLYRLRYLLQSGKHDLLKIAFTLGSYAIITLFFMYHRFEARIFGPLFVYALSVSFLLFNTTGSPENKISQSTLLGYPAILCAGILLICATLVAQQQFVNLIGLLNQSERYRVTINRAFDVLNDLKHNSRPIIIQMYPKVDKGLNVEYNHPLKEFREFPRIRTFPNGWAINSPYYDLALENLHLKDGHDFLKWIVDQEEVILMMNVEDMKEMNYILQLWMSYYLRHIYPERKLRFTPVYDFRNNEGAGLIFLQIKSAQT